MTILNELNQYLINAKKSLGVKNIFLIESSNGYVMSAVADNKDFDVESLGSLSSGSITAMETLFALFHSSKLETQLIESNDEKFFFVRVRENYFLLITADAETKLGFLKLKAEKIIPEIADFIERFTIENKIEVSEIDIDDISCQLDSEFDKLFIGKK